MPYEFVSPPESTERERITALYRLHQERAGARGDHGGIARPEDTGPGLLRAQGRPSWRRAPTTRSTTLSRCCRRTATRAKKRVELVRPLRGEGRHHRHLPALAREPAAPRLLRRYARKRYASSTSTARYPAPRAPRSRYTRGGSWCCSERRREAIARAPRGRARRRHGPAGERHRAAEGRGPHGGERHRGPLPHGHEERHPPLVPARRRADRAATSRPSSSRAGTRSEEDLPRPVREKARDDALPPPRKTSWSRGHWTKRGAAPSASRPSRRRATRSSGT